MAVIFSILLIVSLTQGLIGGVHSYFGMTKDPQPGSGKYGLHTYRSGYACTAVISLFLLNVSLTHGWAVVDAYIWMTKDPQPGTGS